MKVDDREEGIGHPNQLVAGQEFSLLQRKQPETTFTQIKAHMLTTPLSDLENLNVHLTTQLPLGSQFFIV